MKYRYGIDQFVFSLSVLIIGLYLTVTNFNWYYLLASFLIYKFTNIVGVGIGLHEYYSHKNMKRTPMMYLSILCGVGSPHTFYKKHYLHHKYVDTVLDPTSVKNTSVFEVITGLWTINTKEYLHINDVAVLSNKGTYIDTYYYLILVSIISVTYLISIELCTYFILLPIIINTWDSNILFNWYFHRSGHAVNSRLMRFWYIHKYSGLHKIHHRLFKEL